MDASKDILKRESRDKDNFLKELTLFRTKKSNVGCLSHTKDLQRAIKVFKLYINICSQLEEMVIRIFYF